MGDSTLNNFTPVHKPGGQQAEFVSRGNLSNTLTITTAQVIDAAPIKRGFVHRRLYCYVSTQHGVGGTYTYNMGLEFYLGGQLMLTVPHRLQFWDAEPQGALNYFVSPFLYFQQNWGTYAVGLPVGNCLAIRVINGNLITMVPFEVNIEADMMQLVLYRTLDAGTKIQTYFFAAHSEN